MLTTTTAVAAERAFLFATFKGEASPMTEQVYFATSRDGRQWTALNGGEPVLVSDLGEKGVRDPFLIRSKDGRKTYIIATDLSMARDGDWTRAVRASSKSIVIWESTDLVNWSDARLVKVAPDDAGCTWAPEAIYDEAHDDYLVFWASTTAGDDFAKHRIWASRTKDFQTFSEAFIYIDRPQQVIDTHIVRDGGRYYRTSKDEKNKTMIYEVADQLMGPWQDVPGNTLAAVRGHEGPQSFLLEPAADGKPATWCMLLDYHSRGAGY